MTFPSLTLLAQSALSGLFIGSLYGLLGLGVGLSWGLLHIINLAHFGFAFLAAYLCYQLSSVGGMAVLPRDTIYAAVMIICTGVLGLCVLVGGLAHREQSFRAEGAGAGLAALIVMATLTLVLPDFTTTTPGGTYSSGQLGFVAVASGALWAIFVFIQTVRHRDYFIPIADPANLEVHAEPPTIRDAWA